MRAHVAFDAALALPEAAHALRQSQSDHRPCGKPITRVGAIGKALGISQKSVRK
jgi:hypothetical protein